MTPLWQDVSHPASKLPAHQGLDHSHAFVGVVETGDVREILATSLMKDFSGFSSDLLQGLQKVPCCV